VAENTETAHAEQDGNASSKLSLSLLLGVLNTVLVLAAMGTLTYTRLIFKRPQITEEGERDRLVTMQTDAKPALTSGYVSFEPTTVNISSSPPQAKAADGTQSQILGKLHYATIGFSMELKDISRKDDIEALRPLIMDQFLALVGRKQFHELTSVEGRYILRTQLIEVANSMAAKRLKESQADTGPLVVNLYFNQFLVQ
jgi:flagellar basal body-associated protein FliL